MALAPSGPCAGQPVYSLSLTLAVGLEDMQDMHERPSVHATECQALLLDARASEVHMTARKLMKLGGGVRKDASLHLSLARALY